MAGARGAVQGTYCTSDVHSTDTEYPCISVMNLILEVLCTEDAVRVSCVRHLTSHDHMTSNICDCDYDDDLKEESQQ